MFQGVELLLKQLLYFKSPIYVFCKNSLYKKCNDPLNPTLDELFECKSLEIGELCREVKKYYNEFKSLKIVEDLAKERNKIQHFAIKFDEKKLVEDILKLNHKVITPSLRIIAEEVDALDIDKDELNMKIEKIFNLWDIAEKEEKVLNLDSKYFLEVDVLIVAITRYLSFLKMEVIQQVIIVQVVIILKKKLIQVNYIFAQSVVGNH